MSDSTNTIETFANQEYKWGFVTDVAAMNPAAAAYLRRHPCLTPTSMAKWRAPSGCSLPGARGHGLASRAWQSTFLAGGASGPLPTMHGRVWFSEPAPDVPCSC